MENAFGIKQLRKVPEMLPEFLAGNLHAANGLPGALAQC
jgi:hypothetical protein